MQQTASLWRACTELRVQDYKEEGGALSASINGGERLPLARLASALQALLAHAPFVARHSSRYFGRLSTRCRLEVIDLLDVHAPATHAILVEHVPQLVLMRARKKTNM